MIITVVVFRRCFVIYIYIYANTEGERKDIRCPGQGSRGSRGGGQKRRRKKMSRHFNRASFHLSSLFIGNFRLSRPSPGVIDRHCLGPSPPPLRRTLFIPPATPSRPILHDRSTKIKRNGIETLPLHATRDNFQYSRGEQFFEMWKLRRLRRGRLRN